MTVPCAKEKDIEKLIDAVFGNGDPGMRTDIAVIKERMETIHQKIEATPTSRSMKVSSFLGGFVAVALTVGGLLLSKIIGII